VKQADIVGYDEFTAGLMPSGAIDDNDSVSSLGDLFADFLKVKVHRPNVRFGNDPRSAAAPRWAYGSKEIDPGVALITGGTGPATALGPDTCQRSLLADACLILPPNLYRLVPLLLGYSGGD